MIEKTGQVIRCSVEKKSRFSKEIKLKLLTDDGLYHDLMFVETYDGYVPLVGTRITIRLHGSVVHEVIEVNGSPPNVQMTPQVQTSATVSQMVLAVLVAITGVLLIIVGMVSPMGFLLMIFGIVQIVLGFMLYQTLRREIAVVAFMLNLFSMMLHIVPWGGGTIYINPGTALIQFALMLIQIALLCVFLCPKSIEQYYG